MFKRAVPESPIQYLILDEKHFACLVRGGVIHASNLRIALLDTGWGLLARKIAMAIAGHEIRKDHVKHMDLEV